MTGISWHRDTVTRLRAATTTDRYGNETHDWSTPDELPITGCDVQPLAGPEDTVDRQQVTRRWVLFAPAAADITAADRIRWDGDDYDIDGEVRPWRSPTGRLDHIEADLVRVEG